MRGRGKKGEGEHTTVGVPVFFVAWAGLLFPEGLVEDFFELHHFVRFEER